MFVIIAEGSGSLVDTNAHTEHPGLGLHSLIELWCNCGAPKVFHEST